ncbi:MAG: hypothetical protein M3R36_04100 [Bacteroidota bacterium]|nr:hypothetical protein [Bacteroidota bacterium]
MEKVLKLFLLTICFLLACSLFNPGKSEAKSNSNITITSEKADFFIVIRVLEQNKYYIYVYTYDGIFVSKMEEL